VLSPLRQIEAIRSRQSQVASLHRNQQVLSRVRDQLGSVLDLERIVGRVAMEKATPKDLVALSASLRAALGLREYLSEDEMPATEYVDGFPDEDREVIESTTSLIDSALLDEPAVVLSEGRIIRPGFDDEVDRLHRLRDDSRGVLEAYVEEEREATGISSLKVRYNRVLGRYLEVTKANAQKVPDHFVRRQSLANAERFTTERLGQIESNLNEAAERIIELERELFIQLREEVRSRTTTLLAAAARLATLDVLQSLARAATVRGYVAPELAEDGSLQITAGRHAVVGRTCRPAALYPTESS
jgi:DNA mismatch repair protein MutS